MFSAWHFNHPHFCIWQENAICHTQSTKSKQGTHGSTGGGVTQMVSAENPKLKKIHKITVYYNMN